MPHHQHPDRRKFVRSFVAGSTLMPGILSQLAAAESDPLAPKSPHFPAKAKNVIFLFMTGGVSHVDTFDPKPNLTRDVGKEVKLDHPEIKNRPGYERIFLKAPQWEFSPQANCGTEVSSLFPHVGSCMDDIALIRSMHTDHSNHYNATLGMHTGSFAFARPSIGSWVSYGLGTLNKNLPSFITIAPAQTYAGTQIYASDFLPGAHQGTLVVPGPEPIANVKPRIGTDRQQFELAALQKLNRQHLASRGSHHLAEARMRSFETAFGMQMEAPEAFDFSKESEATHELYGLQRGATKGFAWQCLAARRLIERGVRFVELIDTGSSGNWDSHGNMKDHESLARNVDQPIAGLLKDLKSRGMLDDTLVVWTTEFGRTPFNNKADAAGREHHNWAFSSWLAGAGVKGGTTHGTTDEYGISPEEDPVHVHDFHATILHLMGLDHEHLTYRHSGRDYRLTDVFGKVVDGVLS
ncbi:MAG: DUF1501 domain-containing protein [Akkermansiaceae bacterium]|jgi:hypothetical protein|tara:strand:- start:4697 stop:6091 length:1395 start_codon:yes stop_codon:yes gene_type:complete